MKHISTSLFVCLAMLIFSACGKNEKMPQYRGIGTVERTDSTVMIHYYDFCFLAPELLKTELRDSARVEFLVEKVVDIVDNLSMRVKVLEISDDIATPVAGLFSGSAAEKDNGKALLMPANMHLTRDFRRNDFFNITAYYSTHDGNDDRLCLTYDPSEQISDDVMGEPFIVLWLRLFQNTEEGNNRIEYRTISVPLDPLKRDSLDFLGIRVKYFGMEGDTIANDYTYSY